MIIKTPYVHSKLQSDIFKITKNIVNSLFLIGSYKFKPNRSFVSDIDYNSFVDYDDLFKAKLTTLIDNFKKSNNFIFIHISSGSYKGFPMPWKITDTGCEFNYDETISWYEDLKNKNIIDPETKEFIDNRLIKDSLTIRDIIEIDAELEKYFDIKWTETDIINGYKIDKYQSDIRYELIDTLKNNVTILKILYKVELKGYYGINIDYIPIDISLLEDGKPPIERKQKCNALYTEDWYKVFKSLKWKIKPEYKENYLIALLKIDYQNCLLNRLKMFKRILNYNLIPTNVRLIANKIYKEIQNPLSGITGGEKNLSLSALITLLNKKISTNIKDDAIYFQNKLKNQEDNILKNMYFDRAFVFGNIPVSIQTMRERTNKGIRCPFFEIDDIEYNFLYKISIDFLFNPIKFINCFIQNANENNLLIKDIVKIEEKPKFLLQFSDENTIELYKRNYDGNRIEFTKIKDFNKTHLKSIQQYLVISLFKNNK